MALYALASGFLEGYNRKVEGERFAKAQAVKREAVLDDQKTIAKYRIAEGARETNRRAILDNLTRMYDSTRSNPKKEAIMNQYQRLVGLSLDEFYEELSNLDLLSSEPKSQTSRSTTTSTTVRRRRPVVSFGPDPATQ